MGAREIAGTREHGTTHRRPLEVFSELEQAVLRPLPPRRFEPVLLRFSTPDVLIVDDLGLRGLAQDEPADLYEIVRRRYEHGSTIITSNRAIEEWPPMFGNPLLASAAMDRLLHPAHVLVIEGDSYRNPPPARKKRAPVEAVR